MDLSYETVSNAGERVLVGDRKALLQDHQQRYEFAKRFVLNNSAVLDCACGSGYGSELLAESGRDVIGIDISPVAIDYCQGKYLAPNLRFQLGSAEEMDFPAEVFDVVCSIETIEHIPHPERLIREAKRVLRPGGLFIVSTPNRVNSNLKAREKPLNPFHLFEWSLAEFDSHLKEEFSTRRYFGQRIRSRNKLHWKYFLSKLKRYSHQLDITELGATPALLKEMETWRSWQPENFIAVCEK